MTVDIIIPIYKGFVQTKRCLESVRANSQCVPFELVLIDDCSPEIELQNYLATYTGRPDVTLLRNEQNLGFVASVNRGMGLHPDRDVVLLNSDTEVVNDWLDRLRQCAYSQPDIATVTPFSNNATICSYPFEGWNGGLPGMLDLVALDALFARANTGLAAALPTAVGFCMFIRRACLQDIGDFDVERFGRGYGEENDFSLRAAKAGWRNVLAADVFVFHEGGVSFGAQTLELREQATAALLELHPDYLERVRAWCADEPLAPFRRAIDLLRVAVGPEEAGQVLAEHDQHLQWVRFGDGMFAGVEQTQATLENYKSEISALRAGLAHAESVVAELQAGLRTMDALRDGLAHAESLVAQLRADQLAYEREIDALRAGLAHAEQLVVDHQQEIERIKSTRLWRVLDRVSRAKA